MFAVLVLIFLNSAEVESQMCLGPYQSKYIHYELKLKCCRGYIEQDFVCKPQCNDVICQKMSLCVEGKCQCLEGQYGTDCFDDEETFCAKQEDQSCFKSCSPDSPTGQCNCELPCYKPNGNVCVRLNKCYVDGVCYPDGGVHENGCRVCNITESQVVLKNIKLGVLCDDGDECTKFDFCNSEGICTGNEFPRCRETPKLENITSPKSCDGVNCQKGAECVNGVCDCRFTSFYGEFCEQSLGEFCKPNENRRCVKPCKNLNSAGDIVGECECEKPCYTVANDGKSCRLVHTCFVNNTCYRDLQLDDSGCKVCVSNMSKTSLQNVRSGVFCNDHNSCTESDKCDGNGSCVGSPISGCTAVPIRVVGAPCSPVGAFYPHPHDRRLHYRCTVTGYREMRNPTGTILDNGVFRHPFRSL